jgi:membrane-bound serine protease (ClpP class)
MWINAISPILLIIGIAGIYIEMKTPGFGLPGVVGVCAFAIYFLGGYVAGLSGVEWIAVFVLGLILVVLELFVFPGTILLGLMGAGIMIAALVMAMVDIYPGGPVLPSLPQVQVPLTRMTFSFAAAGVICWLLSLWLPKSSIYARLVTKSASGEQSVARAEQVQTSRVGQVGVALSALRPGGKAQFGDAIIDVIAQGEMIAKGKQVRVIGHSSNDAIVEAA